MRHGRPHPLTLLVVAMLWRCASLEPASDEADQTSLVPDDAPIITPADNSNLTQNGSVVQQPNKTTTPNTTTPPKTTTPPTPAQLGFSGSPALGFSLQSTDLPSLCLAARGNTIVSLNSYTLAPCSSHPSQLFYWAQGTFAQSSSLCMSSQHADPGVFNLAGCQSTSSGQYSIGQSGVWLLSQDNNTLYTNGNSTDSGTWTVGPSTNSLAANGPLEMKNLNTTEPVAHFAMTTRFAGATHIYLKEGSNSRCLNESSGTATLTSCASTSSQLWSLKNHNIVSASGLCLAASSATKDSSTVLQTCDLSNLQQAWFIGGGAIGLATPLGSVQQGTLALDVNTALYSDRPVINTMALTFALWSIGAQNYH